MKKGRRPLSVEELSSHFATDDAGDLFWKDEKIKAGGWTAANRLAFFALLVAALSVALTALINFAVIKTNALSFWTYVRGLFT